MASNVPMEIASAIQSASINRHPDPAHDINPSTAASQKQPVTISSSPAESDVAEDEIPVSILNPVPRRAAMPPLPDMRFEQSYLKRIEKAESWQGVLWITFRDEVVFALAQGMLWTLALSGWKHWNRTAKLSGSSMGTRLRRWWWGVNNWELPKERGLNDTKLAAEVKEVSRSFTKYYQGEFASAGQD
ncbi:DUF1770-domain-containing protein [Lophium mytilinum]|uniref:DUF1770-domain-containing protein n=1 Tax=Lophium mytilinum TaxID=390894 RepID=A0A6A6QKG5_9PEZI|nr:DUF1770-domain-containing protein [Lophium mytilinum]